MSFSVIAQAVLLHSAAVTESPTTNLKQPYSKPASEGSRSSRICGPKENKQPWSAIMHTATVSFQQTWPYCFEAQGQCWAHIVSRHYGTHWIVLGTHCQQATWPDCFEAYRLCYARTVSRQTLAVLMSHCYLLRPAAVEKLLQVHAELVVPAPEAAYACAQGAAAAVHEPPGATADRGTTALPGQTLGPASRRTSSTNRLHMLSRVLGASGHNACCWLLLWKGPSADGTGAASVSTRRCWLCG